ncbi:MAG: condensation domain-containing protein, partial [Psychrosphaera sp.]|nr:condensation domain-containing protein [Psychrosphaera sp.]
FPPALKTNIGHNKAAIIALLQSRQSQPDSPGNDCVIAKVAADQPLLLSYGQQRLWFLTQVDADSPQYNMPGAMHIKGDFDVAIAARAFDCIVKRHEPLRTVYLDTPDGPVQQVRETVFFALKQLDFSHHPVDRHRDLIEDVLQLEGSKVFDLRQDLMIRVVHVRLTDDEGVLLFNLHHIASDGWSMRILIDEFVRLYQAFGTGGADPLAPLPIRYADYAQWQRRTLKGAVLEEHLGYWQRQLAGIAQLHSVPLDHPRPPQQQFIGAVHTFELDQSTHQALKQLSLRHNATMFMVLHAAFALLLSRYSHNSDVVLGIAVANRRQQELESLVGFFVNTLVLRVDCAGDPVFVDFLARVRQVNLDAQAHQDVPFELLVEHLNPIRSTAHSPLFQIMFNMGAKGDKGTKLDNLTLTPMAAESIASKFDLTLNASETPGQLLFEIEYNSQLFGAQTISQMADHLTRLLNSIVNQSDAKISQLAMLSDEQSHYLQYQLNNTQVNRSGEQCLHRLFEQQVDKTPDALAVECRGERLSYDELNCQANRLAHYLKQHELNLTPNTLIGVCLPRSNALLVAILAILKAGGGYVPLDPDYPAARLDYMAHDSQLKQVISQSTVCQQLNIAAGEQIVIDDPATLQRIALASAENLSTLAGHDGNSLAYVIYTSGSTGQPKGVEIAHCQLFTYLHHAQSQYGQGIAAAVMSTSVCFDATVTTLFTPLLLGKAVIMVPQDDPDMTHLTNLIKSANEPLLFKLTPAHLQVLLV